MEHTSVLNELVRASSRLAAESDFKNLVSVLVEQSADFSRSDLACLYIYNNPEASTGALRLIYRRGLKTVPNSIPEGTELMGFLEECGEAVVLLSRAESPFDGLFLADSMNSGIVLPVRSGSRRVGALFLNSRDNDHYGNERFRYLDSLNRLAGGLLENARLMKDLKEYLARIEALELYQESIFQSMTNLLVTTDRKGKIRYFNQAAKDAFVLEEADIGGGFSERFARGLERKMINTFN
jgi:adenylate cyclase